MGSVGIAKFTAAASLRRLFTTRHSCHYKDVVMDKRFKDDLDQMSSLSTLVRMPEGGK